MGMACGVLRRHHVGRRMAMIPASRGGRGPHFLADDGAHSTPQPQAKRKAHGVAV
jgi:hypothetical protein